jgi:hypothetical protein
MFDRIYDDLDVSRSERQGSWTAAFLVAGIVAGLIVLAFITGPVR